jgi:hypothetical protein
MLALYLMTNFTSRSAPRLSWHCRIPRMNSKTTFSDWTRNLVEDSLPSHAIPLHRALTTYLTPHSSFPHLDDLILSPGKFSLLHDIVLRTNSPLRCGFHKDCGRNPTLLSTAKLPKPTSTGTTYPPAKHASQRANSEQWVPAKKKEIQVSLGS